MLCNFLEIIHSSAFLLLETLLGHDLKVILLYLYLKLLNMRGGQQQDIESKICFPRNIVSLHYHKIMFDILHSITIWANAQRFMCLAVGHT